MLKTGDDQGQTKPSHGHFAMRGVAGAFVAHFSLTHVMHAWDGQKVCLEANMFVWW